ncbi:hypothetical protein BH23PLA1_BH23PLA1_23790 [soil metagenome]
MRAIQELGAGCWKCRTLAENAALAVADAGVEAVIVKVRDLAEILRFDGVQALPALAIDGRVKISGRVPSAAEIRGLLV